MQTLTIFLSCILCLAHSTFVEEGLCKANEDKVDSIICQDYPRVYKEFVLKIGDKDRTVWIQDATPEYFEQIVEYYKSDYSKDEPLSYYSGCYNSSECLNEVGGHMMHFLGANLSLVALANDDNDKKVVVGYNILAEAKEDDQAEPNHPSLKKIVGLLGFVSKMYNIFELFHVKSYLTSFGLNVIKKYRGLGLGHEILSARSAVAKCNDYKVSVTSFSSPISQKEATRAGFKDIVEVPYRKFIGSPMQMINIEEASNSVKLMYICA